MLLNQTSIYPHGDLQSSSHRFVWARFSLIALDISIIGVAVPKIAMTFRSLDDVAWYGSAYLLTVTAFQPVMGFSYKYFSMLATYLVCVITFEGEVLDAAILTVLVPEMLICDRGRKWARCCALRLRVQSYSLGALCIIGHVVKLNQRPLFMSVIISVFRIFICIWTSNF